MKKILLIIFVLTCEGIYAQSKEEQELVQKTYLLSHTVFGTKDSSTLEDLFARTTTYGHSHGNVQTRKEAIDGISHNQSNYSDTAVSNISVIFANDNMAIVRHLFKANEHTKDGKTVPLNFSMMLVWVKEKGHWKLFGRQAVNLQ